jgi:hypothetical protein
MSALKLKKNDLLLVLFAALLVVSIIVLTNDSNEGFKEHSNAVVSSEKIEARALSVGSNAKTSLVSATSTKGAHPANCEHCEVEETEATASTGAPVPPVVRSQPRFDFIFKKINQEEVYFSRSDFDFLNNSQVGQSVDFELAGSQFSGKIAVVREGERAQAYVLDFPEGNLTVTINTLGEFQALFLFQGDSRVLEITEDKNLSEYGNGEVTRTGDSTIGDTTGRLLASEISVSDVLCAPNGAVYPLSAPQPAPFAGLAAIDSKQFAPLTGPVSAVALTKNPNSGHVLYLDFDGESVTGDFWNTYTGVDTLNAAPAPLSNNDAWVTSVFNRVVEDFEQFNITVTTDRTVFDAADPEQRLQAIITPSSSEVAPGTGGVAFLNSYATNLTRIVWVFNLSEYSCASTVSHEAGHAFGLSHDGLLGDLNPYYKGHDGSYAPGWGPIMGAPFQNGFNAELDQWSKGEYDNANNDEDDVAIIANAANGFGFKEDDFADVFSGGGGLGVGLLSSIGPNQVGISGIISRSGDKDVFRFAAAFSGDVVMTVYPLDVESTDAGPGSDTSGANLAASTRLLDSLGNEVAVGVDFGDVLLASQVQANVEPGIYYLEVDGTGRGDNPTTGFSDYASLGQYQIVGDLPLPPLDIFGSEPVFNASGNITGPGKLDQSVIFGDTSISVSNGTDYGISYPANGSIAHTFLLKNTGLTDLENVSVNLASGVDFQIVSAPGSTIPPGASVFMTIIYDPTDSGINGLDSDTVIVNYETPEPISFEFAIGGLSTKSATEDNYETNNAFNQAANLNSVEDTWLSDYKGPAFFLSSRDDFYTFNVDNDELVTVEVAYDAAEGPITFELRNGRNVLLGTTTAEDGLIRFRVPLNYNSTHQKFYIKASTAGDSTVRNLYDLRWSSISFDPGDDDFYEENDTQDTAFDLTGASSSRLSDFLGSGISRDEDWYKIEVPSDPFIRQLYVRADFVHADGDIDIEIIPSSASGFSTIAGLAGEDEDYEVLSYYSSVATEDFAENFSPDGNIAIMGVEPGTYYIRVSGDFAGNEYDLVIETRQDDAYEIVDALEGTENDLRPNATELGSTIVDKWLSEVDGVGIIADYSPTATQENFVNLEDADWYTFTISPDAPDEQLLIDYSSFAGGTMEFRVYNENNQLVGTSFETNGNVTTFFSLGVISIPRPEGTTFFVEVVPSSSVSTLSGYDFRVTLSSEPPFIEGAVDDNYEENDDFREPFDLSDNDGFWLTAIDGYGTHLDPDWYEITVPVGAKQLFVECAFDGSLGNMDLTLSRKDGPVLFRAADNGTSETITWENPEPGQYAITITGDQRGNTYNLFWDYTLSEDAYEENDSLGDAYDLTGHQKQLLTKLDGPGVQVDEDWYRIESLASTVQLQVRTAFSHDAGDLDIEIYNAAGFLVARSTTVTDDEAITLSSPAAGDYYVRVYYGNAGNEYDLWWGAFSQEELDGIIPDAYEVDNSSDQATPLPIHTPLTELSGLATQTDQDWFEIEISEGSIGFLIECSFTHADGDIDIEVIDSNGTVIVRADSQTDNETINYNAALPGGTYYIRVYGANLGNSYNLLWVDNREDAYEQNDTFETAYDISPFKQVRLSENDTPSQGDDDWYRLPVEDVDSILVIELTYSDPDGSIYYEIYDSDENLLTSDLSSDELKYLQYTLPSDGDFYIRVFGDNAYNEYDLFWNALPDDGFEENDILDDAAVITGDEGVDLEGVVFDADWFVLDPPYGVVSVDLTLNFTHAFGDINVSAYNQFGELISGASTTTDGETLTFEVNPFEGVTYIEVFGADGNYGNPYTLNWVSVTRDVDEDNDTLATATDLTDLEGVPLSESGGFDTAADEDWFFIQPTGSNLFVYCRFDHAEGDIDIELYDQNGVFLLRSISDTDDESITSIVTPGDIYYIRVYGESAGNPYDLVWNSYDADDSYEENDSLATAPDFRSVEYQLQENLIQLDDDWYEIEVEIGDDLLVAEIAPFALVDDMVLGLYDAAEVLIDSISTSEGDTRLEASSLADGIYYLRVSGKNIGGEYSLLWSSGSEDNYEENDSDVDAFDFSASPSIQLSVVDGLGAQYDEDWFLVTLPTDDSTLFVTLDFVNDDGDLGLVLFDDSENQLDISDGVADTETFTVSGLDAGVYYLQVFGPNIGSSYDLLWNTYADDNYEDNDLITESYDLGNSVTGTLSPIDGLGVRGDDEDYYTVPIPAGYVTLDATCTFTHADGDIALELFDGDQISVDTSNGAIDGESVSASVDPSGETFYLLVSGADNSGVTYDLTWTFGVEDLYEDNDSTGTATDITAQEGVLLSTSMGFATQSDSDFYLVTLPVNSRTLNVDLLFDHSLGNIDMNIYDSVPDVIAVANSTTDNETLSVDVDMAGGDYYIEVTGADSGNAYDLIWGVDVDDGYEENDDSTETTDITGSNGVRLSAGVGLGVQYDEDWFSFTTPGGDISLNVLIDSFSFIEGNIDLEIYDASDALVASSTDGANSEEIQIAIDPAGETFKVRVFGADNGNSYDLLWSSFTTDQYEENDFVEDYYDLSAGEGVWLSDVNGHGSQSDDDWYQIVVSTGATTLTIDCTFTHADGDIDLELYRLDPTPDGEKTDPDLDQRKPTLVDPRSISMTDNELIVYDTAGEPGIYFIRVYFGNGGNLYDLRWDDAVSDVAGDSVFLNEQWFFSETSGSLLDPRLLAPLANLDQDAFPNWAEYALALDYGIADAVVVDNSTQEIDGKTYFTISFIRTTEAESRGYQFFVEESDDLSFDGSLAVKLDDSTEYLGNGLERVTYRCSYDMSVAPSCFFRIRVEAPEKSY